MAIMCPSRWNTSTKSNAEKKLFEKIREDLGDEWMVLHSLGLATHPKKPWAEIDFVLIGPLGVFCIEVKGGRVARKGGVWIFTDRDGIETRKTLGPFEQAASNSTALGKYLSSNLPQLPGLLVGCGVAMPDITFEVEGPDIDLEIVYDERHSRQRFTKYTQRLADRWHKLVRERTGRPCSYLTPGNVQEVFTELRRDFDLPPLLRTEVRQVVDELLRLTADQDRILQAMSENARVLVQGSAGTGKTLLAITEARRMANQGKRVFLCCFNKLLADSLRKALRPCASVDVHQIVEFMASAVRDGGLSNRLPPTAEAPPHRLPQGEWEELYRVQYPQLCQESLLRLDRLEEYDVLIVDEAQDLLWHTYLDVFEMLVTGGVKRGNWRFFRDPLQDIFRGTVPEGLERLKKTEPAQCQLSVNCRNTSAIAHEVKLLSAQWLEAKTIVDGPNVELHWYANEAQQRREICECINELLKGLDPSQITVLSRRRIENTCLRNGLDNVRDPLTDLGDAAASPPSRAIGFSTVQAFKGLESDAVLLIDIDDLSTDASERLYVGASRARAVLHLFIAEHQRERYYSNAQKFRTLPGSQLYQKRGKTPS